MDVCLLLLVLEKVNVKRASRHVSKKDSDHGRQDLVRILSSSDSASRSCIGTRTCSSMQSSNHLPRRAVLRLPEIPHDVGLGRENEPIVENHKW